MRSLVPSCICAIHRTLNRNVFYANNMNFKRCYVFGLALFHLILRISGVILFRDQMSVCLLPLHFQFTLQNNTAAMVFNIFF